MNRFVCVCVLFALFIGCCPGECPAAQMGGVIASERVVDLPQDQNKWYLSVVGVRGEGSFETLIDRFNSNKNLMKFKDKVHFRKIERHTVIYRDRYAPNVIGLPTVRLQKANGAVAYEEYGVNLPMSAEGLHGALVDASRRFQGLKVSLPWNINRRRCPNRPCPKPSPEPPRTDPPPQPINDGGPPQVDNSFGSSLGFVILMCFLSSIVGGVVGAGVGLVNWWKKEYSEK